MLRLVGMIYGLACYAIGVASLLLLIFAANNHMGIFGSEELLSLNMDTPNGTPSQMPLIVNIGLLLLFGVQHSVMARPGFKAMITRLLPDNWERSTYVLATGIVTIALVQYWQPMAGTIWQVQNESARLAINVVFYFGWAITFIATFLLNHFHLFGLQQSFKTNDPEAGSKEFKTPFLYSIVRHPIQTGVFIAMISTPDMTMSRAVLAAGMLVYMFIGLKYEERDLISEFGETYTDYIKRVPGVIPFLKGSGK